MCRPAAPVPQPRGSPQGCGPAAGPLGAAPGDVPPVAAWAARRSLPGGCHVLAGEGGPGQEALRAAAAAAARVHRGGRLGRGALLPVRRRYRAARGWCGARGAGCRPAPRCPAAAVPAGAVRAAVCCAFLRA